MARSTRLTRTVSVANLAALDAGRLAELLVEAASAQPALRRRLRLELAAEIGADSLETELTKRIATLMTSRARISWRKRPELVRELNDLRRIAVERLAPDEPQAALGVLSSWIDLSEALASRVKDPKNELADVFLAAASNMARLVADARVPTAADAVAARTLERPRAWTPILGAAVSDLSPELARAVLEALAGQPSAPLNRLRRRLADRAADVDAWQSTFSPGEMRKPAHVVELAARLAQAGRTQEARSALNRVRPEAAHDWATLRSRARDVEIQVLEDEGQPERAMQARWERFEEQLTVEALRSITERLDDFADVEAADRAVAFAARTADVMAGLDFLVSWGSLGEAADAIEARAPELRGDRGDMARWASRLAARRPRAAVLLLRARLKHMARSLDDTDDRERVEIEAEAEALAANLPNIPSHADFTAELSRRQRGARGRPVPRS